MSDLTAAYENAVNAGGRSGAQILSGRSIHWRYAGKARPTQRSDEPSLELALQPFDNESLVVSPNADDVPAVARILVHGSQATADTCDFSDADILVVLDDHREFTREEHIRTVRELRKLLQRIYAFDPLMHHGLMWLPASALDDYDEAFLPVETLRLSKVLFGPLSLQLSSRSSDAAISGPRLRLAAESLQEQLIRRQHLRGDYHLKNFISGILLLPSLFLASKSIFVYKRESFDLARSYFSTEGWNFVARAEEVRRQWLRPLDPWWKGAVATLGHPRSRTLLSDVLPSRLNIMRPAQQAALRALEKHADAFFRELEAALR
ncbi:MAG: hypothetical protein DLM53_00415 [Candidatus Eremiobacter antarcticus]|nr:MAG: hypothetical protein DLM53_00415 [Candidatus Eremiobacter sp. RRmetagenome_bin22]